MSWDTVRVGLIQAACKPARVDFSDEVGATESWDTTSLLALWDEALQEVQERLLAVYEDGVSVVSAWSVESTCPASVRRLVTMRAAVLCWERSPQTGANEAFLERIRRRADQTLNRYVEGPPEGRELLADDGTVLADRAALGKLVTGESDELRLWKRGAPIDPYAGTSTTERVKRELG